MRRVQATVLAALKVGEKCAKWISKEDHNSLKSSLKAAAFSGQRPTE
jgi:hypothetical protein